MTRPFIPTPPVQRLVSHLFDATPNPIGDEMTGWLSGSSRFRAFVDAHRDKIRKKLRTAGDADAQRDVRAELRVAHALLADRRIEVAFEAYGSTKGGPDFTVAFRGERPFNVEVTRLRHAPSTGGAGPLLAKLRQLPPSVPNIILVVADTGGDSFDVAVATRALRERAEAGDEPFFTSRGFRGSREFHQRYLRLGVVLVWSETAATGTRIAAWTNPSARIAAPVRAVRACVTALEGA